MTATANTPYDVVIIGSGAAGGMSAYVLTRAGLKVLMLEAGRDYDPVTETPMFNLAREAPLRDNATPDKALSYFAASSNGGWTIADEPYVNAEGTNFRWFRVRLLGGRTNAWGRHVPRFGPYDFKAKSRDGQGVDWPIGYDDVAPYYDLTETAIGVSGPEGQELENAPASPPGVLQPAPKLRVYEEFFKAGAETLGATTIQARGAILTRPLGDRMACFYATPCNRGCSIKAAFQSSTALIEPAKKTGRLEVRTHARAVVIETDARTGKAKAVRYINPETGERGRVEGRAIVLAASACESVRLLFNSRSRTHPDGLANSSGLVGKYLFDNPFANFDLQFPALEGRPSYNEEGTSTTHSYTPWWGYEQQRRGELGFVRGYHFQLGGGRRNPPGLNMNRFAELADHRYGKGMKADLRRLFGSTVRVLAQGEMIANPDCYCEIDPDVKDRWGVPVLRFHWKWGDNELKQAAHMQTSVMAIAERLGGQMLSPVREPEDILEPPGEAIHEVGGARMSSDAATGVVNQYGQTFDVQNLFIADGAVFASSPHKNPTLTIMALAWRSAEFLARELKSGTI